MHRVNLHCLTSRTNAMAKMLAFLTQALLVAEEHARGSVVWNHVQPGLNKDT